MKGEVPIFELGVRLPDELREAKEHGDQTKGPSDYQTCVCRDCFEITVGHPGVYCHGCIEAGCPDYQGQQGMSQECQREDAYEDDEF